MGAFEESLARGRVIEDWVADVLRRDRWSVIPLRDQPAGPGHGPRLEEMNLPDLQCTKHGQTIAVEVKGKTRADMGRLTKELEHGIDQGSYDSCRAYERIMPTFLIVVEAGPLWDRRDAYAARITSLGVRTSYIGHEAMAYFPRSQMAQPWLGVLNRHVNQKLQRPARTLREPVS
jgi:hypothetical protein